MWKYSIMLAGLGLAALSGCSVSSLRCGTDGDSSYVELQSNLPTARQARDFERLCGFVYDTEE